MSQNPQMDRASIPSIIYEVPRQQILRLCDDLTEEYIKEMEEDISAIRFTKISFQSDLEIKIKAYIREIKAEKEREKHCVKKIHATKIIKCLEEYISVSGYIKIIFREGVFTSGTSNNYLVIDKFIESIRPTSIEKGMVWRSSLHIDVWFSHLHDLNNKHIKFFSCCSTPRNEELVSLRRRQRDGEDVTEEISTLGLGGELNNVHVLNQVRFLVKNMKKNPTSMYIAPYNESNSHWELLVIVPEEGKVYLFDPLGGSAEGRDFLINFISVMEKEYQQQLSDPKAQCQWELVPMNHKKQKSDWECGFYIMLYAEKLVHQATGTDIQQHFPDNPEEFPDEVVDDLAERWCEVFVNKHLDYLKSKLSNKEK